MKSLLVMTIMLIGSSNVFAKSLTCHLDVLNADKAGYLMPSKVDFILTTKSDNSIKEFPKNCGSVNLNNLSVYLCASEADFVGGLDVATIVKANNDDNLTVSSSTLGTLKNGRGLTEVNSVKTVLNTLRDKLLEAGIETPATFENDSLSLDEAVKAGMDKGILVPNEPVVISVGECQLTK